MDLSLWFDLSPVRPWEWAAIEAASWTEAVQIRNAFHAGLDEARAEATMKQRLAAEMDTQA